MASFSEIGIDLGVHEIKIAEANKVKLDGGISSDLNHLKSYKSYPVDCQAYSDEYFKLLKTSIKDYAKVFKKKGLSLNISLPINKHTNSMFLTVPSVSKKDLETGIKFEAEQALALEEIKDAQFTWKIINEYPELNEYEVLLATIDEKIVKALSGFKTIKWKVNRVMLQPILLERFSKGNDIMVDFGYTNTRVYMYKEGKLAEVESINISGFSIEKKIDDYLKDNNIEGKNDFGEEINAKNIIKKAFIPNELIKDINYVVEDETDDISSNINETEISSNEDMERINKEFEMAKQNNDTFFLPDYGDENEEIVEKNEDSETVFYDIEDTEELTDIEDEHTDTEELTNVDLETEADLETEEVFEKSEFDEAKIVEEVSELLQSPINKLIDEIKRVIRSFELQNGINIDNVYYVGELSNFKYFTEKLESQLDLPTKPLNIVNKDIDSLKYDLASLSMLDAKLKDDTNFTSFIKANVDYQSMIIAILAISLSVGLAFFMINDKYSDVISEQQTQESQQMSTISGLENEIATIQQSMDKNTAFIDRIEGLKNQKKWLSDILYVIPDITPNNVVIKKINIVNENVQILGYGADYSSIGFLSAELEKIGLVKIETIEDFNPADGKVYSVVNSNATVSDKFIMTKEFNMTLDYKGGLLNHGVNYDTENSDLSEDPMEKIVMKNEEPVQAVKPQSGNALTNKPQSDNDPTNTRNLNWEDIDTNGKNKVSKAEAEAAGFSMPISKDHWLYEHMDDGDGTIEE